MTSEVNKDEETFFDEVKQMKGNEDDAKFDVGRRRRRDRSKVSGDTYNKNRQIEEQEDDINSKY